MDIRAAGLAAALALTSMATTARATTGGPRTVEVLGYEPQSRSLYYVEHDGSEAGEPPVPYRLPLHGAGASQRVASVPPGLTTLTPLPTDGATIALRCDARGRARGTLRAPPITPTPIRLQVVRGCEAALAGLYLVPWTTRAVAVVRHLGIDVEGGYERDEVVIARYRAPPIPRPSQIRTGLELFFHDDGTTRVDLVVIDPPSDVRRIRVAQARAACEVESDAAVSCGGLRYEARLRDGAIEAVRDGTVVARTPIPEGAGPPVVAAASEHLVGGARIVCTEWDCRLTAGRHALLFEPMRGDVDCTAEGAWLSCEWHHTTRIDMRRRWLVDLARRRSVAGPLHTGL